VQRILFPKLHELNTSIEMNINSWIKNNKLTLIGIFIGAIAGYLYWQQVGCSSGTCLITSKWTNSTAYGAMMGGLVSNIFKKEKKEPNQS
jgi:hypothetical protein